MVNAQSSLETEIQNLKEELALSQQKVDRYAHLIATLSDELDTLRDKICHSCKKKLLVVSTSVSSPIPEISGPSKSTSTASALPSLWRRAFKGRHRPHPFSDNLRRRDPSDSPAVPRNDSTTYESPVPVPCESEVAHTPGPSKSTPLSEEEATILSDPKAEPPTWSVEYHPEAKRILDLQLANVITYEAQVYCVKISPDGHRVAIGLRNGTTYLNELKTGSNICTFVDRYEKGGYYRDVCCLQFSPNGQLLATGTDGGEINIWDIARNRMRTKFKEHIDTIKSIAFSPNGRSLISGSDDKSVRKWNLRDGLSKIMPVTGGNYDNPLWIWDSRKHTLVAKWSGHTSRVRCILFTPDGKGMINGSDDGTVKYWDLSSIGFGSEAQSFAEIRRFSGHTKSVRSVGFFPANSHWIVSSSDDRTVRVWDTESGVFYLTLHGYTDMARGADVSQTHNLLVTVNNRRFTVWKYKVF